MKSYGGFGGFSNNLVSNYGFSANENWDPSAALLFSYMTIQPPYEVKVIYNNFIVGCKQDVSLRGTTSNWEEIYALWIFMAMTRQQAYLNVRYPNLTPASDFVSAAPTFLQFQGVKGNGVDQGINLNWNAATAANTYRQNDSGVFVYCEENNGINSVAAIGCRDASNNGSSVNPRTALDNIQGKSSGLNVNIGAGGTTTNSIGFTGILRDNATQIKTNKGLITNSFTTTSASAAVLNLSNYFCCQNNANVASGFDSRLYSFGGFTSGFCDYYKLSLRIVEFRS